MPSAARTAKTITGYRTYCPLRRCRHQRGERSSYTEEHLAAADRLRRLADAVAIGFGGRRELVPVQSLTYGPRTGPTQAALRQARAWQPFRRAMAPFTTGQREMVAFVLLLNWSISRWTARQRELGAPADPKLETGKLVAILDVLAEHFSSEIDRDLPKSAFRAH